MRAAALAALMIAACYRDASLPPSPPFQETAADRLEKRIGPVLVALDALEKSVAGADCPTIAAKLRAFGADHAADMDEIEQMRAELSPDDLRSYEAAHVNDGQHIKEMVDEILRSCHDDNDVHAALDVAGFVRKPAKQQ